MDVQAIYETVRKHVGRSFRRESRPNAFDRHAAIRCGRYGDDLPITMDGAVAAAAGLPDVCRARHSF